MESITQAISEAASCGEYLKGNKTLYRSLRNSYNQAQSSYRQLMESPDAAGDDDLVEQNIENWQALGKVCQTCLIEDAKDVEVFGWYISAQLFSVNPLQGMQEALSDFADVIERYWSDLHPKPPQEKLKSDTDEGRAKEWAEFKVKPMWQLAGESEGTGILAMPLLNLPLIGQINYTQFYSAERAGSLEELKAQAVGFFSAERDSVTEKITALAAIEALIKRIEKSVNEQCHEVAAKSISFKFLLKLITDLLNAVKYLLADSYSVWPLDVKEVEAEIPQEVEAPIEADGMIEESEHVQAVSSQSQRVVIESGEALFNRDQAFTELRKIAEFFQRTEPHSPVHMLLERAIRWGYMPLPELLAEMIGDNDQVMGRINQLAGLESVTKTDIPAPSVSAAELAQHRSQQAAPPAQTQIQTQVEAPAVKQIKEEPAAAAPDKKEQEETENSSGISSFQW